MKILVIGGCGYIGSVLVECLLNKHHDVTVLDSLKYKQHPFANVCHIANFHIHIGDFRDTALVKSLVSNADCVIHLAAIVGVAECDKSVFETMSVNVDGVHNLVGSMSKHQMLLYPCTNSGYGVGQDGQHCTEETPMNPISLYGKTKAKAEQIVLSRMNSISFRLATVFGSSPCMRTELLVNDFVLKALRDRAIVLFESHFKRNYIHVRDVCSAFVLAINNFETMKSNVYNVGLSSANLSKLELCHEIQKQITFAIIEANHMKDQDQRNYIVSNDKIEKCGFSPQYGIQDGVTELMKLYEITRRSYYYS